MDGIRLYFANQWSVTHDIVLSNNISIQCVQWNISFKPFHARKILAQTEDILTLANDSSMKYIILAKRTEIGCYTCVILEESTRLTQ